MRPTQLPTLDLTLPGTRPTTNDTLPDIRSAIAWRTWEDGCREAALHKKPMLVLAEPVWANTSQRIAFRLSQDATLTDLLGSKVVPVLVDPEERPDLVAEWRWAAMALTGTAGPPLLVFLTHDARPFLAYCTMNIEGNDTYPSLASLVESIAEVYGDNEEAFRNDAAALADSGAHEAAAPSAGWDSLRQMVDLNRGGLDEQPKHPRPALLWAALDGHGRGDLPEDLTRWLRLTLDSMLRGGIYDQLDRGFHRCARDAGWVVPHFEKPVPLNAQLAAVYARAGELFDSDAYRDVARRVASFCMAARDGVDVIESNTTYYTWTAKEVRTQLEPSLLQVVTLHYNIQPVDERQSLRQVVAPERLNQYSHEDINILRTRLMRGRTQLRSIRQQRPSPRTHSLVAPGARATTIAWLLTAGTWLEKVDQSALFTSLESLIEGRFNPEHGYASTLDSARDPRYWMEDQAALLASFVEAHRVSNDDTWIARARDLADVLTTTTWRSDTGWLDHPDSTASKAVVDDVLPAALFTLTGAFQDLANITGEPRYAQRAEESRSALRRLAAACGHWSAVIPAH